MQRQSTWRSARAIAAFRPRWFAALTIALALSVGGLSAAAPASADDGLLTFTIIPARLLQSLPIVGSNATVGGGAFVPTPDSASFVWYLDGAESSCTDYFCPLTADEIGKQIWVTTTVTKSGYVPVTITTSPVTILGRILASGTAMTGIPKPGDAVGVDTSSWSPSGLTFSYQWYLSNSPIADATDSTYALTDADSGQLLSVQVVGSKDGYADAEQHTAGEWTDYDTVHTQQPLISGVQSVGSQLSAVVPLWIPEPSAFQYQWQRDGVAIDGATTAAYSVQSADVGHVLTVVAGANVDGFPYTSATSDPTRVIPVQTDVSPPPIIEGTPQLGVPLHADLSNWSPTPGVVSYSWSVGDVSVPADPGTGDTFTPTQASMIGQTVTVQVDATGWDRGTVIETSNATSPIAEGEVDVSKVKLGTVRLNVPIVPKMPTMPMGVPVTAVWTANGVPIPNAHGTTYTPVSSEYGEKIRVAVTVAGPGWVSSSGVSNSEVVRTGRLTVGQARLSGDPRVGQTLTLNAVGWGPAGVHVSYEWFNSKDVYRILSRSTTYTLKASDLGSTIYALTAGSEKHYFSDGWYGDAELVSKGIFATAPTVSITGTADVGEVLIADRTAAVPSDGVSYEYQWFSQKTLKAALVKISKANSATYRVAAAERGLLISVQVTALKAGYTASSAASIPTSAIGEPPRVPAADSQLPVVCGHECGI